MAKPFKWYWYTATPRAKVVIAALILVPLILALLWSYKGKLFVPDDPNAYKVLEGENNQLREQNKVLRAEADAIKMERDGYKADLEKAGKLTADGVQKQKDAVDNYEQEITAIGVDIPVMERCRRYCTSRANSGIPCPGGSDAYCKLYYGSQ